MIFILTALTFFQVDSNPGRGGIVPPSKLVGIRTVHVTCQRVIEASILDDDLDSSIVSPIRDVRSILIFYGGISFLLTEPTIPDQRIPPRNTLLISASDPGSGSIHVSTKYDLNS
jgi:hypothetical protein